MLLLLVAFPLASVAGEPIQLAAGALRVLTIGSGAAKKIQVKDPAIVDVIANGSEVLLKGVTEGKTSITVTKADGTEDTYDVTVLAKSAPADAEKSPRKRRH
jgi:hypothetical protein